MPCSIRSLRHQIRWIVVILTWLVLGTILSCVDIFSFTMVYMEHNTTADSNIYIYSRAEKSSLISAMALGSLFGMFPMSRMIQNYSTRYVLTTAGVCCGILTMLLPTALDFHYYAALIIRVLQGITYSADFSVVGLVASRWVALNEVGLALGLLSGFTACRALIQLPLAAILIPWLGWRSIFYVLGVIVFILSAVWYAVFRDTPIQCKLLTNNEIVRIDNNRTAHMEFIKVPYKEVLRDKYVWAVWIAGFADIFSSFIFLIYGAEYYDYLGLDVSSSAWLHSFKGVLFLVVRIVVGLGSDGVQCVSEKFKLRFCNTMALQMTGLLLVCLAFLPRSVSYLHVIAITIFQALIGFNCGGFYKGGALVSRQFCHFVIGQIQVSKCICVLLEPILFSFVVPTGTSSEWSVFFLIHAVALTIANTIYMFYTSDKPSPYTEEKTPIEITPRNSPNSQNNAYQEEN